jgi:hypothetical protein
MQPKDHNLSSREISKRARHTPLTSPLPDTQAFTQRGLSVHVNNNGAAVCTKRPLSRAGWRDVRGEQRGVCFFRESLSSCLLKSLRRVVDLFKVLPRHDTSRMLKSKPQRTAKKMLSILFHPKTQTFGALVYPDVSCRGRPCLPRAFLVRGRFILFLETRISTTC